MLSRWGLLVFALVALAGTAAACDGLSPGDELNVAGGICTLGFLVADPDGLYFSTAGHCIRDDEVASTPDVGEWGVGVFHFLEPETGGQTDGSPGMDFALVRVDPAFYDQLNPKMCGYAGPTGVYNETPGGGGVLTYGHGLLWGDLGNMGAPTYARPGYNLDNDGDSFYWVGVNTPGDSGGAVLSDDGRAIGVLTHLSLGTGGTNGGTHLERGFRLAAEKGFTQLRLVTMDEDPVQVLQELRGGPQAAPPVPGTKPTPTNGTKPANTTATNGTAPASGSARPPANDSIQPAAADDDEVEGATTNRVPFLPAPALAFVLALALALALAFRKR